MSVAPATSAFGVRAFTRHGIARAAVVLADLRRFGAQAIGDALWVAPPHRVRTPHQMQIARLSGSVGRTSQET